MLVNVFLGIDMPEAGIVTIRHGILGQFEAAIDKAATRPCHRRRSPSVPKKKTHVSCQDVRNIRSGRSSRPLVNCDPVGGDFNRWGPVYQTRLRRPDVGPYTIHRNPVE